MTRPSKYGDTLCDMHYGLNLSSLDDENYHPELVKQIEIDCETGSALIESIIQVYDDCWRYTNKLCVLIGENLSGHLQFAYSYDSRRFGLVEVKLIPKVEPGLAAMIDQEESGQERFGSDNYPTHDIYNRWDEHGNRK